LTKRTSINYIVTINSKVIQERYSHQSGKRVWKMFGINYTTKHYKNILSEEFTKHYKNILSEEFL